MNTRVGRITHRQVRMAGFAPSPSLSPEASSAKGDDDDDDEDDGASSSDDDEITTSQ